MRYRIVSQQGTHANQDYLIDAFLKTLISVGNREPGDIDSYAALSAQVEGVTLIVDTLKKVAPHPNNPGNINIGRSVLDQMPQARMGLSHFDNQIDNMRNSLASLIVAELAEIAATDPEYKEESKKDISLNPKLAALGDQIANEIRQAAVPTFDGGKLRTIDDLVKLFEGYRVDMSAVRKGFQLIQSQIAGHEAEQAKASQPALYSIAEKNEQA